LINPPADLAVLPTFEDGFRLEIVEPEDAPPRGWRRWLWPAVGIGLFGLLGLQTYLFAASLFTVSTVLGNVFLGFLSLLSIGIFGFVWREFDDLRKIAKRAHLRNDAERLAHSDLHSDAVPLLAALDTHLSASPTARRAIAIYRERNPESLSDGEMLALYERTVMAPLDKQAYRIAMEAGRDIGLLTGISPLGVMDGLLVLWRTTIMLRRIAKLYGLTLGPTATLRLLKLCVRNAAIAGVADMVSHAALEHVGASITAMLSARAGQGAGNALLSARLSLEAIRQSRPLPYITLAPPKLKQIRDAIFEETETPKASKQR